MWPTHSGRPPLAQATLFAAAPSEIGHVLSVESDVGGGMTSAGPFAIVFAIVSAGGAFFAAMSGLHANSPSSSDTRLIFSSAFVAALAAVAGYLAGQRFGVVPLKARELTYLGMHGAARVRRDRAPEILCFANVARVDVSDERRDALVVERTWTFVDHQGTSRFVMKGRSTLAPGSADAAGGVHDLSYAFGSAVSVAAARALAAAPVA
jgi:hypothetical protein